MSWDHDFLGLKLEPRRQPCHLSRFPSCDPALGALGIITLIRGSALCMLHFKAQCWNRDNKRNNLSVSEQNGYRVGCVFGFVFQLLQNYSSKLKDSETYYQQAKLL